MAESSLITETTFLRKKLLFYKLFRIALEFLMRSSTVITVFIPLRPDFIS